MNNIKLSVIIPVYNTEQYFVKCIDSVIASIGKADMMKQSEIIVVNDGSLGNINDIIKEYEINLGNLVYVNNENYGRGKTRNIALKLAKGKYISFVDSDDYIDVNMYKEVFEEINKRRYDLVIFDLEAISEKVQTEVKAININHVLSKKALFDMKILASSCNKVIKKDLFKNIEYPENIKYEDLATIPIVYLKANNVKYIPKMYYKYYLSENSAMRTEFSNDNFNLLDAITILFKRMDDMFVKFEDSDVTYKEVEEYKNMIFTRRFYEDILESIVYIKDVDKKKEYIKKLCTKMNKINYIFDNRFFKKEIGKQRLVKKVFCIKLCLYIKAHKYEKILKCLDEKTFYRFYFVEYK